MLSPDTFKAGHIHIKVDPTKHYEINCTALKDIAYA